MWLYLSRIVQQQHRILTGRNGNAAHWNKHFSSCCCLCCRHFHRRRCRRGAAATAAGWRVQVASFCFALIAALSSCLRATLTSPIWRCCSCSCSCSCCCCCGCNCKNSGCCCSGCGSAVVGAVAVDAVVVVVVFCGNEHTAVHRKAIFKLERFALRQRSRNRGRSRFWYLSFCSLFAASFLSFSLVCYFNYYIN